MKMLWPCDYNVLLCKGRQGCTVIDFFFSFIETSFLYCVELEMLYISFVLDLVPCEPRSCF